MKAFRVALIILAIALVIVTIFDAKDMIVNDDHRSVSGYFALSFFALMMVYRALEKKARKGEDKA